MLKYLYGFLNNIDLFVIRISYFFFENNLKAHNVTPLSKIT